MLRYTQATKDERANINSQRKSGFFIDWADTYPVPAVFRPL